MLRKARAVFCLVVLLASGTSSEVMSQTQRPQTIALLNGRWFSGEAFVPRTVYSVEGRFTFRKPARVDRAIDLAGTWVVPPFAEAHNHNIDGASEERGRKALQKYVADGVFYVKIQGNFPLTDEQRSRLPMNGIDGPDVALAQTFLTAAGGHPARLHENILLPQGYYPGMTKEQLKDKLYFTIDSETDLERQWPRIMALHPDFIKTNLWCSDEYEKRKDDPAFLGRRALDPRLLPRIVAKAHASKLRVSAHITNAADFHNAVVAGVDEIVHSAGPGFFKPLEERIFDPRFMRDADLYVNFITSAAQSNNSSYAPIAKEDAQLAARRGIVVITTMALALRSPAPVIAAFQPFQKANLKLLRESGVRLAVGSDNPADSSIIEADYLQKLGVFDNLALLKMWTETTAKTIFPERRIGALKEGYEASFLALEGNPLEDWRNVSKIKLRFKKGQPLAEQPRSMQTASGQNFYHEETKGTKKDER